MSDNWADKTAQELLSRGLLQTGMCLILGGTDAGKTTLAEALARQLAQGRPVAIVDADTGQSHIGPPATVGWARIDEPHFDLSQLRTDGISFVGDVTPVGHLLQLTAAIEQCVRQASKVTEKIIIDTPGFIAGPAAAALWWTVQRMLQPESILAVQRKNELNDILIGLKNLGSQIELIHCPPQIRPKSPQARRSYRQKVFNKYFQQSCLYNIDLTEITVQSTRNFGQESLIHRLAALRDKYGMDLAVGIIDDLQKDGKVLTVRAPKLDINRVSCLVIGDVTVDLSGE
jgi:polynucleotide 5'-kinase involved in rRNA processing